MLALKIEESEIKNFMSKLIKEETFDNFEVRGAEISIFTKIDFNGILDKDFLSEEGRETTTRNYCIWKQIRPIMFSLIKGSKRPKIIKIIFSLNSLETQKLHENAASLFINILFENNSVLCTTATSQKNFSMDKTLDSIWDEFVIDFFRKNQIIFSK